MEDNWALYMAEINGPPASLFINLDERPDADPDPRPYVCRLHLNLAAPSEDGLTTQEESESLLKLEDELTEALSSSHNGAFVGRVTHDGRRLFFFYLTNADGVEELISHRLRAFNGYRWAHVVEHDPDWKHFSDLLYPSPEEMQIIQNGRVLDALEREGDLNHIARRVDHWLYFPDRTAVEKFKSESAALNFKVELEERSSGDGQWKLRIYREDCVELNHINDITLNLYELAIGCGGEYDGWETLVVRN